MLFPKNVKWRSEKFGAVIFDTLNEKVYVTNETGRDILRLVEEGLHASAVARQLLEDYVGDEAQVKAEVTAFVDDLRSAGLLAAEGQA